MQMACHSISLGSDTQYNNRRYKIVKLGLMWKLMSMIKCYAVSNTRIERKFLNRLTLYVRTCILGCGRLVHTLTPPRSAFL